MRWRTFWREEWRRERLYVRERTPPHLVFAWLPCRTEEKPYQTVWLENVWRRWNNDYRYWEYFVSNPGPFARGVRL